MNIQEIDCHVDLMKALLWQYDNATALKRIILGEHEFIRRVNCEFWDDYYRDVFNLSTANNFGLAIWSRILDIPIQAEAEPQPDKIAFGFGPFRRNFNNGNFGVTESSIIGLTPEQKRVIFSEAVTLHEANSFGNVMHQLVELIARNIFSARSALFGLIVGAEPLGIAYAAVRLGCLGDHCFVATQGKRGNKCFCHVRLQSFRC